MSKDNMSKFPNTDIHYQKMKLKESFLPQQLQAMMEN